MLVGVVGGFVASVFMLLRKPYVFELFCVAFAGTLISVGHASLVGMDPAIEASSGRFLKHWWAQSW